MRVSREEGKGGENPLSSRKDFLRFKKKGKKKEEKEGTPYGRIITESHC